MLSTAGDLLCYCDARKLNWYLDKGLAELVQEDPPTIRLLFEHKNADQQVSPAVVPSFRQRRAVAGTAAAAAAAVCRCCGYVLQGNQTLHNLCLPLQMGLQARFKAMSS
jgi:hypothetical protein